jgi:N-acetylglucosamine kinase-like BadF-type ATPase
VRRALHALDRRAPDTQLVPTLLERVGVDDPRALVAWVSGATRAEVAALVPLVVAVAEEGDAAARDILAEAARALADHVRALRPGAAWSAPVPFAMAGGLLDPGGPLGDAVLAELADLDLDPVGRALRPAVGAAHLARRMTEPEAGA